MKKLLLAFVVVAALLTGCSEKLYEMSSVTITEKKEPERMSGCRGVCYRYAVSIEKDGSTYTYTVDDSSYRLVEVGTVVDITVYNTTLDGNTAKLTPVGVKKE